MSLRYLQIFSEVCRHMNMSRAAEQLYISQSSVSQAIGELEKQYQVRLFERLSKKLYLTAAGQDLLSYARQILYLVSQMDDKMKDAASAEQLRVGACTTVASYFMNPLLDRYQQICPAVQTMVEVGNSTQLEQNIFDSRLDLAFVQNVTHVKDVIREAALADRLILVCRSDHPLAGREVLAQELEHQSFVARETGSGTRKLLEEIFAQTGITPEYAWICNSIGSMKDAVLHGRGICLLSEHLVQKELADGDFATIHLHDRVFERCFYLICHKNKYKTESMKQFITLCQKQVAEVKDCRK